MKIDHELADLEGHVVDSGHVFFLDVESMNHLNRLNLMKFVPGGFVDHVDMLSIFMNKSDRDDVIVTSLE